MKKQRSTKRALLMSALSLMLCFSMLLGTTFAWFTDSASSGRNTIVAGNLDVVLEYWDGDSYEEVTSATKLFDDAAKWEPGYTEIAYLKVSNAGSLALKYQLAVNVYGETLGKTKAGADIKLSDHLVFKVVTSDADLADTYDRETAKTAAGTVKGLNAYISAGTPLENTGDADYVALIIYMPESVGNEANHDGTNIPKIEMGVNLLATQYTYEEDSFDNQYDKMATVDDIDELNAALAADYDLISLGADIALTESITIPAGKTVAIDLAGNTLSHTAACTASYNMIANNGNLTIEDSVGSGKISFADTGAGDPNVGWASYTIRNSGTLVVNNGTIEHLGTQPYNGNNAIFNYSGSTTVNGGTISAEYSRSLRHWNGDVTINGGNFNGQVWVQAAGDCSFTVTGGSFRPAAYGNDSSSIFVTQNGKNVDVSISGGNLATKLGMSTAAKCVTGGTFGVAPTAFVADGYTVIENANGTYGVIAGASASTQTALDKAIANNAPTVVLGSGEYTIPDSAMGKTMTIIGNGDTTIAVLDDGGSEGDIDYSFRGSNVVFENITLNIKGSSYPGYAGLSATYNNCTIVGSNYTLYGDSVFNNCTFNLNNGYVWTWGASKVEFNGCTFEDTVGGKAKAILVHNTVETEVIVKDCKFKATTSASTWDGIPVAAVSIDPENGSPDATVRFEGTNTYSDAFYALYQVKYADEVDDVTVIVDGVEVAITAMK